GCEDLPSTRNTPSRGKFALIEKTELPKRCFQVTRFWMPRALKVFKKKSDTSVLARISRAKDMAGRILCHPAETRLKP
ncbi:MAG: hypothetical protein WBP63_18395, partial [Silvibacterium sp.]